MDIDTWFILNGYMVKWVITLQYPTYIHTYMDNPYPPQTIWVWIWVRAMVNQWHHDQSPTPQWVQLVILILTFTLPPATDLLCRNFCNLVLFAKEFHI